MIGDPNRQTIETLVRSRHCLSDLSLCSDSDIFISGYNYFNQPIFPWDLRPRGLAIALWDLRPHSSCGLFSSMSIMMLFSVYYT